MSFFIRLIGLSQIVIAIVIMTIAGKIDTGISVWAGKLAKTNQVFAQVTAMHCETYRKSVQNISSLQNALNDMGGKTNSIAVKVENAGKAFQARNGKWYYPEAMVNFGKALTESGHDVNALGNALLQQATLIKDYTDNVHPQTVSALNTAEQALNTGAKVLEEMSVRSNSNLRSLTVLLGVVFLLNGFVFFIIPSYLKPSVEAKK